jgi:hypothetical protein
LEYHLIISLVRSLASGSCQKSHISGLIGFMMEVLSNMVTSLGICLFPPMAALGKPPMVPTSENIIEHAKKTNVKALMVVASFANAWAIEGSADTIEYLKSLAFIVRECPLRSNY